MSARTLLTRSGGRAGTGVLALVVGMALAVVLAGCAGPTFTSLPLPGSGVSGPTVTIKADFGDALNLAQGAAVRVNGVDSGRVVGVRVHDFTARVTMKVQKSAELRSGATARLRYTTPLGELFVDVTNPSTGPLMSSGHLLGQRHTSTAPTVEDALSEASMLINGGGLGDLQTITTEANKALGGREQTVRDLLARSTYLITQLNDASPAFARALDALGQVSTILDRRKRTIDAALRDVRPAAHVLHENLAHITALLATLQHFASTANGVVSSTRAQVLRTVREAGPVLQEMVSVRSVLPATLEAIVQIGGELDTVFPGDWFDLGVHLDMSAFTMDGTTTTGPGDRSKPPVVGGLGGLAGLTKNLGPEVVQGVTSGLLSGLIGGRR